MAKRKGSSGASNSDSPKRSKREDDSGSENPLVEEPVAKNEVPASPPRFISGDKPQTTIEDDAEESIFVGEPVPDEVARNRWPHRYRGEVSLLSFYLFSIFIVYLVMYVCKACGSDKR